MYRSSAAGYENKYSTIIAVLCLLLTYTQAAINNSNNNGNSARPNGQYSSYQQNDAAAAAVPTTYFTNNQNQYVHNNQQQQPHYQQQQQQQHYQQQSQQQQQHQQDFAKEKDVLERFHHRFPDGSYEFRYELADGTARYERGYFLIYDKIKTLVVVGYYSYRQTDGRYITVFYNADQNGYRQNQSITPQVYPNLPRSIEVPQFKESIDYATERPNKGRQ
ncbi:3-phosphoinositide-dependent protein kinase 1 [Ceratitis capitata]|uniref:3-phosphoinositide-dependent protein kinase 1 n=1 Tax=Ceratitis capitata TaxID=7213 RepID=UPI0006188998|nr:3-phosphoinositide-dependent protein kinase 1 [Ceratitis capitata]